MFGAPKETGRGRKAGGVTATCRAVLLVRVLEREFGILVVLVEERLEPSVRPDRVEAGVEARDDALAVRGRAVGHVGVGPGGQHSSCVFRSFAY